MSFRRRAVKAIVWSAVSRWGARTIAFATFVVLARLLQPEMFGIVAVAMVFIALAEPLLHQGMERALIQRVELEREHLDTAFWVNVAFGGAFALIGIAGSGLLGRLLDAPESGRVFAWLSGTFFLASLSITQRAILQRRMDFKSLAIRSLIAEVAGGVVGIGSALAGLGVWSLVAKTLTHRLVGVVVLWSISDWRPGLGFSKKHFVELFQFGALMVGNRLVGILNLRLPDLIVGYVLGPVALGYLTVASRLLRDLVDLLSGITASVAFPVFSRIQANPERVRRAFYEVTELTALAGFPLFLALPVLAADLIPTVLGSQWIASTPIMQVLALAGIVQCVSRFNGNVMFAMGRPVGWLVLGVISVVVSVVTLTLIADRGIVAVAIAFTAIRYAFIAPSVFLLRRVVGVRAGEYFSRLAVPFAGATIAASAMFGVGTLLGDAASAVPRLIVMSLVGGVIYVLSIQLIKPALIQRIRELIVLASSRSGSTPSEVAATAGGAE